MKRTPKVMRMALAIERLIQQAVDNGAAQGVPKMDIWSTLKKREVELLMKNAYLLSQEVLHPRRKQ